MSDTQIRVVLVTAPDAATADKIAAALVESKLAACVNIVPGLVSHYVWEGKPRKDAEVLLLIKTRAGLVLDLAQAVKEKHPAKVPEIVSLPVAEGDRAYLDWVAANTRMARPVDKGPAFQV